MGPSDVLTRLKRTENPTARDALLHGRGALHALTHGHVRRAGTVRRYLAGTSEPRLQIGAGPKRLPGWLDTDLISGPVHLDLARPLPLPDAAFQHVFGEHVIEHLPEGTGAALLGELHRVLRPGGVLRLTTPDLQKLIAFYEDRNPEASRETYAGFLREAAGKPVERPAQVLNNALRLWGHRHVYDEEDLTARLQEAGFVDVVRRAPGESPHPHLRGVERHGPPWLNVAEAMCLEATRP